MKSIFVGMEKLSLVDYDGKLSCVLFTDGCNFRCPFCHNSPLIVYNNVHLNDEEIFEYLEMRKKIIDAVVISGGEPTLKKELKNYLFKIKKMGFLIKLDTNGTNPNLIKEIIEEGLVDYIAMDIKNGSSRYEEITGNVSLKFEKIKESIDILINSSINYEFRTTLVQEYHTEEDIIEIGSLIAGAKKIALQKFVLRDTCLNQSLREIKKEQAEIFKSILEQTVKNVILRGY